MTSTNTVLLIIVCALIVLGIVVFCLRRPTREGYGFVMGALGEYQPLYYKCISDCEREDPSKYLGKTKGSLMCDAYCNSTITDMARRGGPSYPMTKEFPSPKVQTRIDECYKQCGEGAEGYECRSKCTCQSEVVAKCTQECAYSRLPKDTCMNLCSKSIGVNCSSTDWTWK